MQHDYKPIQNLFLDNNILNRMLKVGFQSAISKLSDQFRLHTRRYIETGKTNLIFTPSSFFEVAGLKEEEFLSAQELESSRKVEDSGDSDTYLLKVFDSIKTKVDQKEALSPEAFVANFNEKYVTLPADSQFLLKDRFIDCIKNRPSIMDEVRLDLSLQLFCSLQLPEKHSLRQHLFAIDLSIQHFKQGHITSVAKLIPSMWRIIRNMSALKMNEEERRKIDRLSSLKMVSDFLDSDLVHLAVMGIVRSQSQPVYSVTEDPMPRLRQRVLLYKSAMKILLANLRKFEKGQGGCRYQGIDLKSGYVVQVDSELKVRDYFKVQKLRT